MCEGILRQPREGGQPMKYTVLIYETAADFSTRADEQRKDAYWGAYRAYTKALTEAGVMVGGAGLQPPPLATTVRLKNGKRHVQDGPFAEAKEQLGGYYVIEVPDLDRALDWAARCRAAAARRRRAARESLGRGRDGARDRRRACPAGIGGLPRRAAEAPLRLRPPGPRRGSADAADATDRPRSRRSQDRYGLPRHAGDDEPAARSREDQDSRCPDPARGSRAHTPDPPS